MALAFSCGCKFSNLHMPSTRWRSCRHREGELAGNPPLIYPASDEMPQSLMSVELPQVGLKALGVAACFCIPPEGVCS